jgi:hypothetical protein
MRLKINLKEVGVKFDFEGDLKEFKSLRLNQFITKALKATKKESVTNEYVANNLTALKNEIIEEIKEEVTNTPPFTFDGYEFGSVEVEREMSEAQFKNYLKIGESQIVERFGKSAIKNSIENFIKGDSQTVEPTPAPAETVQEDVKEVQEDTTLQKFLKSKIDFNDKLATNAKIFSVLVGKEVLKSSEDCSKFRHSPLGKLQDEFLKTQGLKVGGDCFEDFSKLISTLEAILVSQIGDLKEYIVNRSMEGDESDINYSIFKEVFVKLVDMIVNQSITFNDGLRSLNHIGLLIDNYKLELYKIVKNVCGDEKKAMGLINEYGIESFLKTSLEGDISKDLKKLCESKNTPAPAETVQEDSKKEGDNNPQNVIEAEVVEDGELPWDVSDAPQEVVEILQDALNGSKELPAPAETVKEDSKKEGDKSLTLRIYERAEKLTHDLEKRIRGGNLDCMEKRFKYLNKLKKDIETAQDTKIIDTKLKSIIKKLISMLNKSVDYYCTNGKLIEVEAKTSKKDDCKELPSNREQDIFNKAVKDIEAFKSLLANILQVERASLKAQKDYLLQVPNLSDIKESFEAFKKALEGKECNSSMFKKLNHYLSKRGLI